MKRERILVLAAAARSGRIGYVLFIGDELKDWGLSRVGSKSARSASVTIGAWIQKFEPTIVVLEDHGTASRKGRKTKAIIRSMTKTAQKTPSLVSVVTRVQNYANKFDEAEDLAQVFPNIAPWVPDRPKLWEKEPRNLIYFEALALAKEAGFVREV